MLVLKFIPFVGSLINFGFAIMRFKEGDIFGGILEVISGIIGLIPGCGPQIIVITAYTKDIISFPALAANAISQDGDALFPLLVRHKSASLWATIHTTIPAIIVGVILLIASVNP